ncbi:MAG: ABC transporter ATP-binding protein [Lachnospiraceae bacterium]|nr:ABC transporter ATP-binding protein [Lachnospiraceae bacterium]
MIKIENLSVAFDGTEVVKKVCLTIDDGEIVGVVGESGSGKSVTALTMMGLVSEEATITSGKIWYDDTLLLEAGKPRDKALYRSFQGSKMSMIFQEPMTSLNPTKRVGNQVEEMLKLHTTDLTAKQMKEKVLEAFLSVGLKDAERVYSCYPHQLSGGMRQRVMIAMAIILHPGLVVADEPTTALDVSVQSQIIRLLRKINKEQKNSMLFITHDLNLAKRLCNRVVVMKDGNVVESGTVTEIFDHPKEEYTRKLIEAVPSREKKMQRFSLSIDEGQDANGQNMPLQRPDILEVKDLNVSYMDGSNSLFSSKKKKQVVTGATFTMKQGEILGLVGESGCGKTTLSKAILGMNKDVEGSIIHHSNQPQMIFQDPYSSLNPAKTIGWLLQEPLRAAGLRDKQFEMTKQDREAAAFDMLHKVGLSDKYFYRKSSQLSGGQRQRISIAQALITRPGLVIADEPVSALDVTIQAQIMELMRKLQEEMKLSFLFISHDINVIYQMSDRIMVMKEGRIVEIGETQEIFDNPKEAYTKQLLAEV